MIITTNLSLQQMKNPEDEMHKKIYDRTKNCVPVQFGGESRRHAAGKDKMERFKDAVGSRGNYIKCLQNLF